MNVNIFEGEFKQQNIFIAYFIFIFLSCIARTILQLYYTTKSLIRNLFYTKDIEAYNTLYAGRKYNMLYYLHNQLRIFLRSFRII